MPMTALIRNLATMTRVGVLAPGSDGTAKAVAQLGDAERIRRARVHPIARARRAPHVRVRPRCPRPRRVDPGARDRRRARRRVLHGVRQRRAGGQAAAARARRVGLDDVAATVAGVPGLTPRDASAALALVTAATEERYEIVGFFAGRGGCRKRARSAARRLRRRPDAARDLAAAAARRRREDGVRPAVRRHRLRPADAVRAGAASGRSTRS